MIVYALICEAHSDDDRLLGVYESIEAAAAAYDSWEDRSIFPFYRVEAREPGAPAARWALEYTVYESTYTEED